MTVSPNVQQKSMHCYMLHLANERPPWGQLETRMLICLLLDKNGATHEWSFLLPSLEFEAHKLRTFRWRCYLTNIKRIRNYMHYNMQTGDNRGDGRKSGC